MTEKIPDWKRAKQWNWTWSDASILTVLVCTAERPRGWSKFICFSSRSSTSKGREVSPCASLPGSLFFRSDECVKYIVRSVIRYHVVTHADTGFYKFFFGNNLEHSLKPTQFGAEMVEIEVDGEVIKRLDKQYQPKASRWSNVNSIRTKSWARLSTLKRIFNFRPYTFTPWGKLPNYNSTLKMEGLWSDAKPEVPMKFLYGWPWFLLLCFP